MSQPGYRPSDAGERWSVNMPAVIGVVFVFLVGVIVWVISTSGGDDGGDAGSSAATATTGGAASVGDPSADADSVGTQTPDETSTTTPAPMPDPSDVTTSSSSTTSTVAPEVTAAPSADADAVPGDLGVPGRQMQRPGCDDSFITIIASAVGDDASASGIAGVLDTYPGSSYLRTDQTCPSLAQDRDGEPIYVVYFGPFAFDSDACAARAEGPEGAYARRLSTAVGPDHSVACA